MDKKECSNCRQLLPLFEFYKIKASDEKKVRTEKVCKDCKRQRRQKKQQVKKSSIRSQKRNERNNVPSWGMIEPQKAETTEIANGTDFSQVEQFYGRKLDAIERRELVQNLNQLVLVLKEEYSNMVGCDVFIKRQN